MQEMNCKAGKRPVEWRTVVLPAFPDMKAVCSAWNALSKIGLQY